MGGLVMMKEDMNGENLEVLSENLEELKEDVLDYADESIRDSECRFRQMKRELRRKTDDLAEELAPIIEKYKSSGREAVAKVEDKIAEKPITSLLLAFTAGIIIGKLLDNNKR